jgi:hypothetical protein
MVWEMMDELKGRCTLCRMLDDGEEPAWRDYWVLDCLGRFGITGMQVD